MHTFYIFVYSNNENVLKKWYKSVSRQLSTSKFCTTCLLWWDHDINTKGNWDMYKSWNTLPPLVGRVSRPSPKNCTKVLGTSACFAASIIAKRWSIWAWTPPSLTWNKDIVFWQTTRKCNYKVSITTMSQIYCHSISIYHSFK